MRRFVGAAVPFALLLATSTSSFAQSACEADLSVAASKGEPALREALATKLLCEYSKKAEGYLERALAATTFYFERSRNPACEILLEKARLHVRAAEDLTKLDSLSEAQRDALGKHWGAAWDMATGISYAWTQSEGATEGDEETRNALNAQVYERCVGPARGILEEYPSVTITVEPEEIDGYALYWDETRRHENLPRILPSKEPHRLRIDPPPGYRTTVRIDGRCFTQEGQIMSYLDTPFRDPVRPHQVRVNFTSLGERVPEDVRCSGDDGRRAAASDGGTNWLLWGGIATTAVGVIGMGYSFYAGSTYQDEADALQTLDRCTPVTRECFDEYYDKTDTAYAWYNWGGGGFGVLTAVGITGIVFGLLNDPDDDKAKPAEDARLRPYFHVDRGRTSLGVSGTF